jgi:predicted lipid-binding transport protein (Tim44 family)
MINGIILIIFIHPSDTLPPGAPPRRARPADDALGYSHRRHPQRHPSAQRATNEQPNASDQETRRQPDTDAANGAAAAAAAAAVDANDGAEHPGWNLETRTLWDEVGRLGVGLYGIGYTRG